MSPLLLGVDRNRAWRGSRESLARFRALVENSKDLILVLDSAANVLYAAPSVERLTGYPPADVVGTNAFEYLHPDDVSGVESRLREVLNKDTPTVPFPFRVRHRDGRWLALQAVVSNHVSDPLIGGLIVNARDVTDVERAARLQEAVLETAKEWRDTFDAIDCPVIVVDQDAKIRRLNRAAVQVAGIAYLDALEKRLNELGDRDFWKAAEKLVRNPDARQRSGNLCRDAANGRIWEISVSRLEQPEPARGPKSIVVARDISSIVRLQESANRAEAMASMGSLVAGVAHEVRNPLFAISATLDAFEARFGTRDDFKKYAVSFRSQVNRLNALMRDLLDYGKPALLEFREVAPLEIVRDAVRGCADLADRRRVLFRVEVPEDLPTVTCDRSRIVQVFVNLVENAIQHSPEMQPVVVRAESWIRGDENGIQFQVQDLGPGFQETDLPKLFDPFFTRREGGTGLGLAIVRKIVDEHGGSIALVNRPEGGANVSLWLPLEPEESIQFGTNNSTE